MPDWGRFVSDHLRGARLPSSKASEIVEELAQHLCDVYHESLRRGMTSEEARRDALREAPDWRSFRREIEIMHKQEVAMNDRVKHLRLPGFIVLLMSQALGAAASIAIPLPFRYWFPMAQGKMFVLWIPWFVLLPVVGALAVLLCRRWGGRRRDQITVSLFPVLAYAVIFAALLPVAFVVDGVLGRFGVWRFVMAFTAAMASWVIVPCLALLCGALLVARRDAPAA